MLADIIVIFSNCNIAYIFYLCLPSHTCSHSLLPSLPGARQHFTKAKQEPKDAKTELSAELKQKVAEDRSLKQKKAKGFRGLQPQERPITLPGGRKWRNAKDAMNEEMIAEIISSQAELIMGSTLGYVHSLSLELSIRFCLSDL